MKALEFAEYLAEKIEFSDKWNYTAFSNSQIKACAKISKDANIIIGKKSGFTVSISKDMQKIEVYGINPNITLLIYKPIIDNAISKYKLNLKSKHGEYNLKYF